MSPWLLSALVMIAALVVLVAWASRRGFQDALAAVAMMSLITTLVLVCLTQAFNRPPFIDLALVLSSLSFGGAIAYARFIEGGLG